MSSAVGRTAGAHAYLVEMKGLYYAMWRQQVGERRLALAAAAATPRLVTAGQA